MVWASGPGPRVLPRNWLTAEVYTVYGERRSLTLHRSRELWGVTMMERWGAFVARRALAVLLAGLAVAVAAGAYGFGVFDHLSQGGFDDADSESARELVAERDTFGNQSIDVVAHLHQRRPAPRPTRSSGPPSSRSWPGWPPGPHRRHPLLRRPPSRRGSSARTSTRSRCSSRWPATARTTTCPTTTSSPRRSRRRPTPAWRPTSPVPSRSTTTSTRSPARTWPAPRRSRCPSCSSWRC